jgi:hypothetical protein
MERDGRTAVASVRVIAVETELEITPALARTQRLAGRFTNFKPVLGGRVDVAARDLIRRMFRTQGRAGPQGKWEALKPSYLKRRQLPLRPILRQGDALYDALTKRGHPHQRVTLEADRYALTVDEAAVDDKNRSIRARFIGHQFGVPRYKVPERQIIPDPVPKTFFDKIRRLVRAYIVRGEQ